MSRVLPPSFKPVLNQPADLLQDRSVVGCKTLLNAGPSSALLVNLFYSDVAKQVWCFLLPVLSYYYIRMIQSESRLTVKRKKLLENMTRFSYL